MAGEKYNELIITFTDNGEEGVPLEADITADNIVEESMKLTQSINDENYLKFGGCIAAQFSIDLLNTDSRKFTDSLVGRWISVKLIERTDSGDPLLPSSELTPGAMVYPGNEFNSNVHYLFSGKIESATLDKNDLNVRNIVAYDAMAILYATDATNYVYQKLADTTVYWTIGNALTNCLENNGNIVIPLYNGDNWYQDILEDNFDYDGSGQVGNREYVKTYLIRNNDWKDSNAQISYGTLLRYICEDVAAFGVIVPDSGKGSFKMVTLAGAPTVYQYYENLQAEEYISTGYTDFVFSIYGSGKDGKNAHAVGGLSHYVDDSIPKTYDFVENITIWEQFAQSGGSRTSTMFDRLINTSDIGYRVAMNPENGDCAFDSYRPLKATLEGTPEQIIGKPITIVANKTNPDGSYVEENGEFVKEYINTYVFKRTLTGIQALTDEIEVKGQR